MGVFLCAFLAFAGLPRLNIHFGFYSLPGVTVAAAGCSSAASLPDTEPPRGGRGKMGSPQRLSLKHRATKGKTVMVAKTQQSKVACAEEETNEMRVNAGVTADEVHTRCWKINVQRREGNIGGSHCFSQNMVKSHACQSGIVQRASCCCVNSFPFVLSLIV